MSIDPLRDIVCRRHPEAYNSPANIVARHVVERYLPAYNLQRQLRSSNGKGMIFEAIADEIKAAGCRNFYKMVGVKLVVMSKKEVRLKIGHWLRDATQSAAKKAAKVIKQKTPTSTTEAKKDTAKSLLYAKVKKQQEAQEMLFALPYDSPLEGETNGLKVGHHSRPLSTKQISSASSPLTWNSNRAADNTAKSTDSNGTADNGKLHSVPEPKSVGRPNSRKVTALPYKTSTPLLLMANGVEECKNIKPRNEQDQLVQQSLQTRHEVLPGWGKDTDDKSDIKEATLPTRLNPAHSIGVTDKFFVVNNDNNIADASYVTSVPDPASSPSFQLPGIQDETSTERTSGLHSTLLDQSGPVLDAFDSSTLKAQQKELDSPPSLMHQGHAPHCQVDVPPFDSNRELVSTSPEFDSERRTQLMAAIGQEDARVLERIFHSFHLVSGTKAPEQGTDMAGSLAVEAMGVSFNFDGIDMNESFGSRDSWLDEYFLPDPTQKQA